MTGEDMTNEEYSRQCPAEELAGLFAKACVEPIADYEQGKDGRCYISYWWRWLKEKHV